MAPATPIIAATYAEIALKGRNRSFFMRRLLNNMRAALVEEPVADIQHVESRLLIHLDDARAAERITAKLKRVFGLQWISPVVPVDRGPVDAELAADLAAGREPALGDICRTAVDLARGDAGDARNFKVETRRSDRSLPLTSQQISVIVGGAVHQDLGLPGRMKDPDFVVNVLVLRDRILVFSGKEPAYGGLPAGASGRAMVLLSGGIDSPVAAWLMMRRGLRPEFVHFHSGRGVDEADVAKIDRLAGILARYYPVPLVLYHVPVVPYEERAIGVVPDRFDMVMFRRFMFKAAARLARSSSCRALVSGDSLGQVASQTLRNLGAIAPDITLPVLRPLVGMDKHEITAWSRRIGLYETSILPYRDCCSIRSPSPVLNARPEELLRFSARMDLDAAVATALAGRTKRVIAADNR